MIRFSLIRHARTQWNLEKKLQGRKDLPLCAQGEIDARVWAEKLVDLSFDRILASPLIRARQTATIIADRLKIEIVYDEDLVEQNFGQWEGLNIKELRRSCPGELERMEALGWAFRPPEGEDRTEVLIRGLRALARTAEKLEDKNLLVVTHNTMIKCLIYHGMGRQFLPEEPEVLQPFHLQELEWDSGIKALDLNPMDLMEERRGRGSGSDKKEGLK